MSYDKHVVLGNIKRNKRDMAKQIISKNVIGRDKIIADIWKILEKESIVFTAERRIGKTTVLKKMAEEPRPGKTVLYSDLEKVSSPAQFVEVILNDLSRHLTKTQKAVNWVESLAKNLGSTELAGIIKLPPIEGRGWQSLLEKTFNAISDNQTQQEFIFLWDEIPYMLQKIYIEEKKSGVSDNSALAILDNTLRALRTEYKNLRMIFTGSVGLHHVLTILREGKYASQPFNDMVHVGLGPLLDAQAMELAQILIHGEDILCDDEKAVISSVIKHTDAVPFYMHRIVSELALLEKEVGVNDVEEKIREHLVADNDPWEMEHFRTRLNIYYKGEVKDADDKPVRKDYLAKLLLNHLAQSESPQTINECFAAIKAEIRIQQRDIVIELLKLLANDHYLDRDNDGGYRFRFPLVKRWWVLAEGLN